MELTHALLIYFFTVTIIFLLAKHNHITVWSSFILAILVGIIILSVIYPISTLDRLLSNNPLIHLYTIIQLLTFLILLFYILDCALSDHIPNSNKNFAQV